MSAQKQEPPWLSENWLTATRSLTNDERGVYINAISLIYASGGPVARSEIVSWCTHKSNRRAVSKIIDHLIFRRKLQLLDGDLIDQGRCKEELAKLRNREPAAESPQSCSETAAELQRNRSETAAKPQRNISKQNNGLDIQPRAHTRSREITKNLPSLFKKEEGSEASASGADAPQADPVKEMFDLGVEVLGAGSRSLIGKARKQYGDLITMEALLACRAEAPSQPVEFFVGCLKQRGINGHKQSADEKLYEGAFRAAEKWERGEADRGLSGAPLVPLLDRG